MTHPILVQLYNIVVEQYLGGLRLHLGKPSIVQALTNEHITFLAPNRENINKTKYMCRKCFKMHQG